MIYEKNTLYKIEFISKDNTHIFYTGYVINEDEHLITLKTLRDEEFQVGKAAIVQSMKKELR